jgi:2-oxoisovalerate dehydrogenase E1 component
MVERCLLASQQVKVAVEVIDLRTIAPWDSKTVLDSARKTHRCLIVHEDTLTAGFGAEVAATVARDAFLSLDAPVERLAVPDVPLPYSLHLLRAVLPGVETIAAKMEELLAF